MTLIVKTLYADSPGLLSMPQLWQALHKHWSSPQNMAEADVEWNDDLVGFFNAVPRADILKSVHHIVKEYIQLTGHTVLAVDLLSKSGHPGQPRGKTKLNCNSLQGYLPQPGNAGCKSRAHVLGTKFLPSCPVSLSCWQRDTLFRLSPQRCLRRCYFSDT